MAEKLYNLILINRPVAQATQDFMEIGKEIERIAPEIQVIVVHADFDPAKVPEQFWTRPTLTVSFTLPGKFRPRRGKIYHGYPVPKFEQMKKFAAAGIPMPKTLSYPWGRQLKKEVWGDHVILKATALDAMSNGDTAFLMRTERVHELAGVVFPDGHPARKAPLLVQQFIDTGEYPSSYRVLTLFGEPILSMIYKMNYPRPPLDASDEEMIQGTIASNRPPHYTHLLQADPEVLEFARRASSAMPRIPLQGMDFIREEKTGKLYILEVNPGGNTWHFSSQMSEEGRREISREQRMAQFDAWKVVARVLASRVRNEAA
ncbi:MAG: hypothetical protein GC184_07530 [Rhizobiales bacterium]|nr:hypothetical protein [Hyphomicrobiales bacterium]